MRFRRRRKLPFSPAEVELLLAYLCSTGMNPEDALKVLTGRDV